MMNEKELMKELKEINLLQQTLGILDWDIQTGMPEKASEDRSEVNSFLVPLCICACLCAHTQI